MYRNVRHVSCRAAKLHVGIVRSVCKAHTAPISMHKGETEQSRTDMRTRTSVGWQIRPRRYGITMATHGHTPAQARCRIISSQFRVKANSRNATESNRPYFASSSTAATHNHHHATRCVRSGWSHALLRLKALAINI